MFYQNLPTLHYPLDQLLEGSQHFVQVPESWYVIVTDVKNSTSAVEDGNHQMVNLIATGSIIAIVNIAQRTGATVPFFFGGDGATLLVPGEMMQASLDALNEHQQGVRENFGLALRVGQVAVADLLAERHSIRLAKLNLTSQLSVPIALGNGLNEAERRIKADQQSTESSAISEHTLDLTGMMCRWDKIKPPNQPGEILTLLINAAVDQKQGPALAHAVRAIEHTYGSLPQRIPVSVEKLRLKASLRRMAVESRTKHGRVRWPYVLSQWLLTGAGSLFYGKTSSSRKYMQNLVLLSDTLSIDGRINTVISGTEDQRQRLLSELAQLEQDGLILYGSHVSDESIMSCYVRSQRDEHLHFVDGAGGGYTQAAKELKRKLVNQS